MKNLTIILVCILLLIMPSQAAERNQQQSQDTARQFEEIEKYIARLRRGVEIYYTNQIIEVKQRAEAEIRQLEVADKPIYAGLAEQAQVAETVLHIDSYGYRAPWYLEAATERSLQLSDDFESYSVFGDGTGELPRRFTMSSSVAEMAGTAEIVEIDDGNAISGSRTGSISTLEQSWIDNGDLADVVKRAPKQFAVTQSLITDRKSDILAKMTFEIVNLERQKNYALTVTLPELENRLKQDLLKPEAKATRGLVTGIVYSTDKPCAVVDGQVVHEGDVISGVTVVKIDKDSVKFSKKKRDWEQKVQQSPASYW